jgi:hypothetical protein
MCVHVTTLMPDSGCLTQQQLHVWHGRCATCTGPAMASMNANTTHDTRHNRAWQQQSSVLGALRRTAPGQPADTAKSAVQRPTAVQAPTRRIAVPQAGACVALRAQRQPPGCSNTPACHLTAAQCAGPLNMSPRGCTGSKPCARPENPRGPVASNATGPRAMQLEVAKAPLSISSCSLVLASLPVLSSRLEPEVSDGHRTSHKG